MTNYQSSSPFLLSNKHNTTLYETTSITSKRTFSNDLHDISYLLKRTQNHRDLRETNWSPAYIIQQQTIIRQHETSPSYLNKLNRAEKREFNKTSYCIAYCTIIILGISLGGWFGGLFEFITNGLNGCNNEQRGHIKCQVKYATRNVTARCVNIFYTKLTLKNNFPFICLCRFRNYSRGKYRDCEFLHANIRYI
ncbi:hypothetical protein I4U23_026802 [Adineta vaga]|nr:hypothetical protein I4U23_026802 [Adineta vaga]